MRLVATFIISVICLSGCVNSKKANEVQQVEEKVFAVHDEVMPEMAAIDEAIEQLSWINKKLKSDTSSMDLTRPIKRSQSLIESLSDANAGMMNWMRGFDQDYREGKSDEEALAYLNTELTKIQSVANEMNSALQESKNFINGVAQRMEIEFDSMESTNHSKHEDHTHE